jgi:hypothetical protein
MQDNGFVRKALLVNDCYNTIYGVAYEVNSLVYILNRTIVDRLHINLSDNLASNFREVESLVNDRPVVKTYKDRTRIYVDDLEQVDRAAKFLNVEQLTYIDGSTKLSLLAYLSVLATQPDFHIVYGIANTSLEDTTGRSLYDIATRGYRGNRLDIMISSYVIYLVHKTKGHLKIADFHKGHGILFTEDNKTLRLFLQDITNQPIIDFWYYT